jgi:hypothetical protein
MKYPKRSEALKEYYRKHKKVPYVRTAEHKEKMRKIKMGQTHSEETRIKISLHHADISGENNPMYGKRGKLHPGWRGGKTVENEILRKSLEFRTWRTAVFKRDKYTCIWCGAKGNLNADHIKPWSLYPELRYDMNNGRTLCEPCHKTTDTYAGRMNRKEMLTI